MTITYKEEDLDQVADKIIKNSKFKIICFYGEMGAGKTTLAKAILKNLGATDLGSSPTFGIVNEYFSVQGELLAYHFDFYRLNDEMEALDLGLEDYLSSDAWIFIEWPEKITSLLPENVYSLRIEILDEFTRKISLV